MLMIGIVCLLQSNFVQINNSLFFFLGCNDPKGQEAHTHMDGHGMRCGLIIHEIICRLNVVKGKPGRPCM